MNQTEDLFKKIGSQAQANEPSSEGFELFQRYQRKEISHEDYLVQNGLLIASDPKAHFVIEYVQIPQELREYAEQRAAERIPQNKTHARGLGFWIAAIARTAIENDCIDINFQYFEDVLRKKNLDLEADRLRSWRFKSDRPEFPMALYLLALKAQRRDSRENQLRTESRRD